MKQAKMVTIPDNLFNKADYPGMVHWFSPKVLFNVVRKVLTSTVFAQYADRRLIHASLDPFTAESLIERCGGELGICGSKKGAVWVDYVADLGDGFDSTYAIAYLIGQKSIVVDGLEMPRADCLIMGGDEVYPDASRYDYLTRMQRPYECAFPRSKDAKVDRPPVFLIPGNHDWYDGLTLFLAKFCRGISTHLGSWDAHQHRSYFAVQLANNWWIWGYDSQLGEDIDIPQASYFVEVAKRMPDNAKVILCAAVPTWLKAETNAKDATEREIYYRGLRYMTGILESNCKGAKVPLVLSGDLHHYSRYLAAGSGTQFITAGGGGAFLHPTHHLPEIIKADWGSSRQDLVLGTDSRDKDREKREACYPSRSTSRILAWGNLGFIFKNADFCITLGVFYFISALLMLAWGGYGEGGGLGSLLERAWAQAIKFVPTPIFLFILVTFLATTIKYADIQPPKRKRIVGALHGLIHIVIIVSITALLSTLLYPLIGQWWSDLVYFITLGFGMIASGFIGGFVWGIYLLIASFVWASHANDSFSAMRLNSFRHFLRLKIEGDMLVVFPIGIDKSPKRSFWKFNDGRHQEDQNASIVVPKGSLGQHLIEGMITIDARMVKPLILLKSK